MDLFFVISGFIMAWLTRGQFGTPRAPGRFLLRRAIRIVPPYWFFTTLMVAGLLIAPGYARNTTLTWPQVLTSYAFVPWPRPSDGSLSPLLTQGWTLNYEAFFYICFALALLFRRGIGLLVATFVGLALIHALVPANLFVLRFYTDSIILEFLAGIGLERLYSRGVRLPLWASLILAMAALAGLTLLPSIQVFADSRFIQLGLPAIPLAAAFILAPEPERPGVVRAALQTGGDASYTLYLSHAFSVEAAWLAWRFAGIQPNVAGVAVAVAVSIAVAILIYIYAERPITEALHRYFGFGRQREAEMVAP